MYPAFILTMLVFSHFVPAYVIPRYDFIFIVCIGFLGYMVKQRYHTLRDVGIIALLYYLGLMLEIYKVKTNSFIYYEFGYTEFLGVPLFSGLIYSSLASVLIIAQQKVGLVINTLGNRYLTFGLGMSIYFSFFIPALFYYLQYILLGVAVVFFYKTNVVVFYNNRVYTFPLLFVFGVGAAVAVLAQVLIANVCVFSYTVQHTGWQGPVIQKAASIILAGIAFFIIGADRVLYNKLPDADKN